MQGPALGIQQKGDAVCYTQEKNKSAQQQRGRVGIHHKLIVVVIIFNREEFGRKINPHGKDELNNRRHHVKAYPSHFFIKTHFLKLMSQYLDSGRHLSQGCAIPVFQEGFVNNFQERGYDKQIWNLPGNDIEIGYW